MKLLSFLFVAIALTGCGGGGSSSPNNSSTPAAKLFTLEGSHQTLTVNNSFKSDVSITGNHNLIYIQTPTSHLLMNGNHNNIIFSNGATTDNCIIIGDNNDATKPAGLQITCNINGSGNTNFM